MKMRTPLAAGLGLLVASTVSADMTGTAFEIGYAWSGEDFSGNAVSGYVVDLYLEFDGESDVLLNIYNFNDVNLPSSPAYYQGLTSNGWAPNEQGGIFTTEVSQMFDSFIAIGGVTAEGMDGNPYQMAGNGVAVDPNFGQSAPGAGDGGNNNTAGPGFDAGWFNGNPNNPIGAAVDGSVFIGRFSIADSDGFSLAGSTGFATYNQGLGTPGQQESFDFHIPSPGALAVFGLAGLANRRRRNH